MTPQEYLEFTRTTAARKTSGISDEDWARYVRLGLISEVGEVAGQVKRIIRDDGGVLTPERREKLLDELGDVLWYWAQRCESEGERMPERWFGNSYAPVWDHRVAVDTASSMDASTCGVFWDELVVVDVGIIAKLLGSTLEDVAARNVAKLSGRVAAGTINGEGDDR